MVENSRRARGNGRSRVTPTASSAQVALAGPLFRIASPGPVRSQVVGGCRITAPLCHGAARGRVPSRPPSFQCELGQGRSVLGGVKGI